jgi:hypothetical protein
MERRRIVALPGRLNFKTTAAIIGKPLQPQVVKPYTPVRRRSLLKKK